MSRPTRYLWFMSSDEYDALMRGETLENETDHAKKAWSRSKGFCFFPVGGHDDDYAHSIDYYYEFASGIVSEDVCVVFESNGAELRESKGTYADPCGGFFDTIRVEEFCTERYDRETMVPLYVCTNFDTVRHWLDDEYPTVKPVTASTR